jgi:hypothetical protein
MSNVIVTGPGKCGASLLMRIFTELGMDTGGEKGREFEHNNCTGNYEWPLRGKKLKRPIPYIIKEPQMCCDIDLRIEVLKLDVDYVYVMLRRPGPEAAALEFMRHNSTRLDASDFERSINGTILERVTESMKLRELQVIHHLAELDIPHTLVSYPRYAADFEFAYSKFGFLMKKYSVSLEKFVEVCERVVDPKQVQAAYDSQPEWNRAKMREVWNFRDLLWQTRNESK